MAATAMKAELSLSKTCKHLGITESGKRWLDLALDPFKDINMPTAGYPDEIVLPSVVQTIHESVVITRPTSVADGATWDCNVFIDQLYKDVPLFTTVGIEPGIFIQEGQTSSGAHRGGIQIRSGPSGVTLGADQSTGHISFKSDVLVGADNRMLGCGLEIHNVTEPLHKSGALITYRIADTPITDSVATLTFDAGTTACISSSATLADLVSPPLTASEAIDLPKSLQWEAKDGAYIQAVLACSNNKPLEPEALMIRDEQNGVTMTPIIISQGAAKLMKLSEADKTFVLPWSLSGVYLTGLSSETKLQLNIAYYMETFPDKDNPLRRLTSPSPAMDAKALELYGKIVALLPTGVEVSENFLGGFMSGVASIARGVATYAPQIMRGLGIGANIAQNAMNMFGGAPMIEMPEEYLNPRPVSGPALRSVVRKEVAKDVRQELQVVSRQNHNNTKQIVPYRAPRDIIVVSQKRSGNVVKNTGAVAQRSKIAKRKQNEAIRNALAGDAPSRWVTNGGRK